MREKARGRAQFRLLILCASFVFAFGAIGARMGLMAATEPVEPKSSAPGAEIIAQRADITDRNGRVLATNMTTHALYAHPKVMVDPKGTAAKLAEIFPELDAKALERRFTDGRSFVWIRKVLSPEQMQKVHEIGDPGLFFGPREMRLYPERDAGGACAGRHLLRGGRRAFGGSDRRGRDREGAGCAAARSGAGRQALTLSIDLTLQATVEEVLAAGMTMLNAKGAAAILMDARTGEILALASLPTFDPERPARAHRRQGCRTRRQPAFQPRGAGGL
jgi:cell division protein FtsI (penicillin-binding protein 3)